MHPQDVPPEHQAEYATLIEQLSHFALEIDNKLPMYLFVLKSEDAVKKLIAIVRVNLNVGFFCVAHCYLWHRFLLWDNKDRCFL